MALVWPGPVASAPSRHPAELGVVTIAEGKVSLTRGTSVFSAQPGVRIEAGDMVAAGDRSYLQIEGEARPIIAIASQTRMLFPGDPKEEAIVLLDQGWLKMTLAKSSKPVTIDAGGRSYSPTPGAAVVLSAADPVEAFVESGTLTVRMHGATGTEMRASAGQYAVARGSEPLRTSDRPTQAFLAALPTQFRDRSPELLAHFRDKRVAPKYEREVSFAEVDQWLNADPASRRELLRRFRPRLKNAEFRRDAEARIKDYPEWDRILHPAKYKRKPTATASAEKSAPTGAAPVPAAPEEAAQGPRSGSPGYSSEWGK